MSDSKVAVIETASAKKSGSQGLTFRRFFTQAGVHPFDQIEWELRSAVITNEKGEKIFEQKNVEIPKSWSMTATNVVVSKYFHGLINTPERETSVRQIVDRVAKSTVNWGRKQNAQPAQPADRNFMHFPFIGFVNQVKPG